MTHFLTDATHGRYGSEAEDATVQCCWRWNQNYALMWSFTLDKVQQWCVQLLTRWSSSPFSLRRAELGSTLWGNQMSWPSYVCGCRPAGGGGGGVYQMWVTTDRCSRIRYNSKKFAFSSKLCVGKRNHPMAVTHAGSLLSQGGKKHTHTQLRASSIICAVITRRLRHGSGACAIPL